MQNSEIEKNPFRIDDNETITMEYCSECGITHPRVATRGDVEIRDVDIRDITYGDVLDRTVRVEMECIKCAVTAGYNSDNGSLLRPAIKGDGWKCVHCPKMGYGFLCSKCHENYKVKLQDYNDQTNALGCKIYGGAK